MDISFKTIDRDSIGCKKIKLILLFNDIAPVDENIKKPYKVQSDYINWTDCTS
jgi:hypothetical protein